MCLKFGFVIFWQKEIGAKALHKNLVKLTSGETFFACFVIKLKEIEQISCFALNIVFCSVFHHLLFQER